jgi:hypothetical protein
VIALLLAALTTAQAHQRLPAYLLLQEAPGGEVAVFWKVPVVDGAALPLAPVFPERCEAGEVSSHTDGDALRARWRLRCGDGGLAGATIGVRGLVESGADAVVRVERPGGELGAVLHPGGAGLRVVEGPPRLDRSYLLLGLEHILRGADHLLFVGGLLLIVGRRPAGRRGRALLATITAFTVAHSATLALAVLGLVRLPVAGVEAVIALSILALARELLRPEAGGLTRRRPWLVAGACGLLHGLGFAGALAEVGLPEGAIPAALLMFNLGVEAGQLLFVAAAGAAWALVGRRLGAPLRAAVAWGMGGISAYWVLDRAAQVFTG